MSLYEDLSVGQVFESSTRKVTQDEIRSFADLSGDFNPLHLDETWVRKNTTFRTVIAHGLLMTSITSGLPTPGLDDLRVLAYLGLDRKFVLPAYPEDEVRARHTVATLRISRSDSSIGIVSMSVELLNQRDETLQTGTDTYLVARSEVRSND